MPKTDTPLTDAEAAEMEQRLMQHRAQKIQAPRQQTVEEVKPIIDLAQAAALKEVEEALPALLDLSMDRQKFPNLFLHLTAIEKGIEGFRQYAAQYDGLIEPAEAA